MSDLKEIDHKQLAEYLIKNDIKTPCSIINILPEDAKDIDFFQFFLNVFMELICITTENLTKVESKDITVDNLKNYMVYMNTICAITDIKEYSRTDHSEFINKHYCRIALRLIEETFFIARKISNNFHFLVHSLYADKNPDELKLKDLYAVIHLKNNRILKISFSICNHASHQTPLTKAVKTMYVSEFS